MTCVGDHDVKPLIHNQKKNQHFNEIKCIYNNGTLDYRLEYLYFKGFHFDLINTYTTYTKYTSNALSHSILRVMKDSFIHKMKPIIIQAHKIRPL